MRRRGLKIGLVALLLMASPAAFGGSTNISLEIFASGTDGALNGDYPCSFCLTESASGWGDCFKEIESTCGFTEGVFQEDLDLEDLADRAWPETTYIWIKIGGEILDDPLTLDSAAYAMVSQIADEASSLDESYLSGLLGTGLRSVDGVLSVRAGTGLTGSASGLSVDTTTFPLRSQVPILSAANRFSGANNFTAAPTFEAGLGVTGGKVGVGDATPDYSIEVGATTGSDAAMALSDGDVAHGMTDAVASDAWFHMKPVSSTVGGADLRGYCDADADCTGMTLRGITGASGANAIPVTAVGLRKSGTTTTTFAGVWMFRVLNNETQLMNITSGGNTAVYPSAQSQASNYRFSAWTGDTTGTNRPMFLRHDDNNVGAPSQKVLVLGRPDDRIGHIGFYDNGGNSDWRMQWLTGSERYFSIRRRTVVATDPTMSDDFYIDKNGNIGLNNNTTPQSALHVPDGEYLQPEDNNAGAPAAGDCDADAELGRVSFDNDNNRGVCCTVAARGWDYADLTE